MFTNFKTVLGLVNRIGYSNTREFVFQAHRRLRAEGYFDIATDMYSAWVEVRKYCQGAGLVDG